jgi:hypothetical protein
VREILRWQSPPVRTAFADEWGEVADQLRESPGLWAVIWEGRAATQAGLVTKIKAGVEPFAPAGAFEAVSRTLSDVAGKPVAVFARYVAVDTESTEEAAQ